MTRIYTWIFSALILAPIFAGHASAEGRAALVVSVANYDAMDKSTTAEADGKLVAGKLKSLGYDVTRLINPDAEALRNGVSDFAEASRSKEHAVVFLAGIGGVIDGKAYLISRDMKNFTPGGTDPAMVAIDELVLRSTVCQCARFFFVSTPRIVLNFKQPKKYTQPVGQEANQDYDLSLMFGTRPNQPFLQIEGPMHSIFAEAFVNALDNPGIGLEKLMRKMRDAVLAESDGKQSPLHAGRLGSKEYILGPKE